MLAYFFLFYVEYGVEDPKFWICVNYIEFDFDIDKFGLFLKIILLRKFETYDLKIDKFDMSLEI